MADERYPETEWHRNWVAHNALFSTGADAFWLMKCIGLKQEHKLVDIGAGSFRIGRFFMMYLNPGCYFAIEPNKELVQLGIDREVSPGLMKLKKVRLEHNDDWDASIFNETFDWVFIGDVLTHADHDTLKLSMENAYKVLRPGGFMIVNYFVGEPHHDIPGWNYPNVAPHYRECFAERLPAGFDLEDIGTVTGTYWLRLIKR